MMDDQSTDFPENACSRVKSWKDQNRQVFRDLSDSTCYATNEKSFRDLSERRTNHAGGRNTVFFQTKSNRSLSTLASFIACTLISRWDLQDSHGVWQLRASLHLFAQRNSKETPQLQFWLEFAWWLRKLAPSPVQMTSAAKFVAARQRFRQDLQGRLGGGSASKYLEEHTASKEDLKGGLKEL